jgi:hypothetical protein
VPASEDEPKKAKHNHQNAQPAKETKPLGFDFRDRDRRTLIRRSSAFLELLTYVQPATGDVGTRMDEISLGSSYDWTSTERTTSWLL